MTSDSKARSEVARQADAMYAVQRHADPDVFSVFPRPCWKSTENFIHLLHGILMPGHGDKRVFQPTSLRQYLGKRYAEIYEAGAQLIASDLRYEVGPESPDTDYVRLAGPKILAFLRRLPAIYQALEADIAFGYENDPSVTSPKIIRLAFPGLFALLVYRCAHELHTLGVPNIPRLMTELSHSQTGIDIHPAAKIEPGIFIDHGTGTVIGETCVIASKVLIYHGVTLGAYRFPKDENGQLLRGAPRHPRLMTRVTVCSNASVLGAVTIGEGSVIGANVRWKKDLEPGMIVRVRGQARQKVDERARGNPTPVLKQKIDSAT